MASMSPGRITFLVTIMPSTAVLRGEVQMELQLVLVKTPRNTVKWTGRR